MQLGPFVAIEQQVPVETVLLLRHSSNTIKKLLACHATVEEYTAIQPNGTQYDYLLLGEPKIGVVVVVVDNNVYGVFRIIGVSAEGTNYSLASLEYQQFDKLRDKPELDCRRYSIERVASAVDNQPVIGWERRQSTPVQRSDSGFFYEIEISSIGQPATAEDVIVRFNAAVEAALRDLPEARRSQLREREGPAPSVKVQTTVFIRNPAVAAEVLFNAGGICAECGGPAPFKTRAGQPYLEVHHRVPLASGGSDTEAICPNCHREKHYG
jgi:HNH endonuclease